MDVIMWKLCNGERNIKNKSNYVLCNKILSQNRKMI